VTRRLRAAVVGAGHFGAFHAAKYAACDGVELVAIVDANAERAAQVAARHGGRAYTSVAGVLGQIDLASVAVPTELHGAVGGALLDAGVHVLVEKPIATSLAEADDLIARAARNGCVLAVGHLERCNPAFVALRARLHRPLFVEAHRLATFKGRATDVDVVLDLMIHDLDLVLGLVPDEVIEVRANGIPVLTGTVDIAAARIEFANGCVANLTASRSSGKDLRRLRVFEPNAYLWVDLQGRTAGIARRASDAPGADPLASICSEEIEVPPGDALQIEVQAFVDAVRGARPGGSPLVSGAEARRALAVAMDVQQRIGQSLARTGLAAPGS
jgi:predicted dehydrogenase